MPQPKPAFAPDYVQVHERIAAFYAKYPEGSLQSDIVVHTDNLIVMVAKAFRSPADERPGIGHSSLEIPGHTSFTRGSEIENCETSAWGRAIAALGFEVKRGIATQEEVDNKRGEAPPPRQSRPAAPRPAPTPAPVATEPTDDEWDALVQEAPRSAEPIPAMGSRAFFDELKRRGVSTTDAGKTARSLFGTSMLKDLTDDQRAAVLEELAA